jgi:hypothetical protein
MDCSPQPISCSPPFSALSFAQPAQIEKLLPGTAGNDHWEHEVESTLSNPSSPSFAKGITSGAENTIYVGNPGKPYSSRKHEATVFRLMHVGARGKLPGTKLDADNGGQLAVPAIVICLRCRKHGPAPTDLHCLSIGWEVDKKPMLFFGSSSGSRCIH